MAGKPLSNPLKSLLNWKAIGTIADGFPLYRDVAITDHPSPTTLSHRLFQ